MSRCRIHARLSHTYTYVHVMYTRVEFDFSNGVTAHTRHTQIPFCGLPIECRTLSFHRSPLPFFPPYFFPSSPPFFPFPLSLSLSTLSAVTRHASTRFVSFVSNNCRQQNGTMRMQMIPFKLAHGSIFMRLNRRRGFLVRWFRKFFSSKSFSDRSRFKQVERWAWINGN